TVIAPNGTLQTLKTTYFVDSVAPGLKKGVDSNPTASEPVVAVFVRETAGKDGVLPSSTFKILGQGRIKNVTLGPGASITFRVKVLLGAIHQPDPSAFTLMFITRMREVTFNPDGSEQTQALFCGCADYPLPITLGGTAPLQPA